MKSPSSQKVLVALRMAGIAGQEKLAGIFRFLGDNHAWDLTLVRTAAEFTPARMRAALTARYDGFIVSIPDAEKTAALLADSSIPTVVMDIHDPALAARTKNIAFIRNDPEAIGRAAADFLLSTGRCRAYAFVQNPSVAEWSTDRAKAFRAALRDRGFWCHELPDPSGLARLERPVGVFAANDDRGYDTLEWCHAHRLRVPEDVLVLGTNNDTLICENCRPTLTSIQPDFEQEGFLAAQVLSRMMTRRHAPSQSALLSPRSASPQSAAGTLSPRSASAQSAAGILSPRSASPQSAAGTLSPRSASPQSAAEAYSQSVICNLQSAISSSDQSTLFVGVKQIVRRGSTAEISQAGKLVQRAVAFIRKNAVKGIGVPDVVRHLGCSRRLADLRFRELQGSTIGEMIIETRLGEVRRLLKSTRDPIDRIAADCGYANPNYLKNLFKRRYGMTMRDFRA